MEVLPVKSDSKTARLTRRQMLGRTGKAAVGSAVMGPLIQSAILSCAGAAETGLKGVAGIDRVTILPGKTYLRGWAGYGDPPPLEPESPTAGRRLSSGPRRTRAHSRVEQGFRPGRRQVRRRQSADHHRDLLHARRLCPAADRGQRADQGLLYAERVGGDAAAGQAARRGLHQELQDQQPALERARQGADGELDSALHRQINRTDLKQGPGGIDNFVEAGKALRGEPHGAHKGYVFSNAWVHQTVEAMSIALMIDPQGDPEIIQAHEKMRATLEDWIPKILAAQEPDGYLQTAFTLPRVDAARQYRPRTRSSTGNGAAITKATPPATSWNRPSITT